MTNISLIAAVDENNGIGLEQQLLCHLPADLQYFKKVTLGKPIIMGRATFESIGKPLPGRRNIVLSQTERTIDGVDVFRSLAQALQTLNHYEELIIIGGGQIFKQTLPSANKIYLTRIHHTFNADVFFPVLEENDWLKVSDELRKSDEKNQYDLSFQIYERKSL